MVLYVALAVAGLVFTVVVLWNVLPHLPFKKTAKYLVFVPLALVSWASEIVIFTAIIKAVKTLF